MIFISKFLAESRKTIANLIWLAVAVAILSMAGRYLYHRATGDHPRDRTSGRVPPPVVDWSAVDAAIADALKTARAKAEEQAGAKLDEWIASLMTRVDGDFLEWYFRYWTQQVIGVKGMWYWAANKVVSDQPTMAEKMTGDIQEEFSKRVLRPQLSQLEIERIAREVVQAYVTELGSLMATIPSRYGVPRPDWERHLEDIALLTSNVEGNREVPLTMKTVVASSAMAATVAARTLGPVIAKVGGNISGKLAGKATAKIAAKTGAKVAAKGGGKFAGPIIGIGVLIWDVWDHNSTKDVEKPVLRQTLADYFSETKQSLLHDTESGIISIITSLEASVIKQLRK